MTLEEALTALEHEGYADVSFIVMPNGLQYRPGRTQESLWVCEIESYPGDPKPFYAWGKTRAEAAERVLQLVLQLHPQ